MKKESFYLIIAHGSRDEEAAQAFNEFLNRFRSKFPNRQVQGAYLEICKPSIPEALETCIKNGAKEIFVMPLMFFPGRHIKKDIPAFIEEAKAKHPEIDFHYSGPLADHPLVLDLLEEKTKVLKGQKSK